MLIERKDALLDFGTATSGTFANIVDLGATDADSLEVVFTVPTAISSATTFSVLGGSSSSAVTTTLATCSIASLPAGGQVSLFVPRERGYRYITAGTSSTAAVKACLDCYPGK